ncbi:gfo/Idh/MocA family oxidoreductase [Sulfitobacter sp. JL08]|uniref:Gfo/Idh/MocA family protein n=1 Tax=Sulfitobacter sp. JL08 TaxID=2070369 RepID=UPI000E0BD6CB|nr:Gfo/Idh/MocA family oxidoreductase [Sulfitobacter sp. JL08]AXI56835.1 gfo/Idh/MocA family oxidoreductase [Sulfitobacter sp. JL08]
MQTNSPGYAIVGCGRIGKRHAGHAVKFGRLTSVCDVDPEKAAQAATADGATVFTDYDDMLTAMQDKTDLIAVCTPNGLHAEHVIKAFKAGYHVLCEKPMALSVHDCGEMIKAGEAANRRLFVVKQNRYNPPVEHLKSLIESGKLGRIYSVHLNCFWNRNDAYYTDTWKGTTAMDGGTLYTQFSHFIDLLYWLVGDVQDVASFTDNFAHQHSVEFEDTGAAILRFYNGAIGSVNFTINSYGKNMEGSLTLFCEKGTIKIGGQYLNEIEYENIEGMDQAQLREGRSANEYGQYQGSMSNHEDVYENIHKVLTDKGTIGTIGFEGLKTVEIIDKIYRAANRVTHI